MVSTATLHRTAPIRTAGAGAGVPDPGHAEDGARVRPEGPRLHDPRAGGQAGAGGGAGDEH